MDWHANVCDVLEALIRHDYGAAQTALDIVRGNPPDEEVKWGPIRPGSAGYPTNEPIPGSQVQPYPIDYYIPGPTTLTEQSEEGAARMYRQDTAGVLADQQAHDQAVAEEGRRRHEEMLNELRELREEMYRNNPRAGVDQPESEVHKTYDPDTTTGEGRKKAEEQRKADEKANRERIAREKAQADTKPSGSDQPEAPKTPAVH
jgi:hypothetical protein